MYDLAKTEKALLIVKEKLRSKLAALTITGEPVTEDGRLIGYYYHGRRKDRLLILLHGGGFMMPGAANGERLASELAQAAGQSILSLEYPLSPESPYPGALDFLLRVIERYSPECRISLMGCSAGANLAAAAVIKGAVVDRMVLNYPYLDLTEDPYSQPRTSRGVSAAASDIFRRLYCSAEQWALPTVSPLLSQSSSVTKTLVIGAGCDGLLGQAKAFAEKQGDGCTLHVFEGVDHSFIEDVYDMVSLKMTPPNEQTISAAREAVSLAAEFLEV